MKYTLWAINYLIEEKKLRPFRLFFFLAFHILYMLTYLHLMCIFHWIDNKEEIKVRDTNDDSMRQTKQLNIERKERKNMLKKNIDHKNIL